MANQEAVKMVHINIDGQDIQVEAGSTILQAAKKANIYIPTLCNHPDQKVKSNCRICLVEIEGQRLLQPACSYPVAEGMVIKTASPTARKVRHNILELILSHHPQDCLVCSRSGNCELQKVTQELHLTRSLRYDIRPREHGKDTSSPSIVRDSNKCILCGRCVYACNEIQTVGVLSKENRGFHTVVVPPYEKQLADSPCINCGQCVQACPVGALTIHDDTEKLFDAIRAGKKIVGQVAPAVRITLAEALGEKPGTISTGRMVTAMKKLGFDMVFDTNFSADLTIMEEGYELLDRIQNGGTLPMITSCSPGWVKFCETFFPKQIPHLSTCKSPQQMFGAVLKTYYAEKSGEDPANIFSVSIMPCTAKKYECKRPEMASSGYQDVDIVLTVQELANLIKSAGISFADLPDTDFDLPFGLGSGAGEIFGVTGGVMEAALRTVYEVLTGKTLEKLDFHDVRGFEGIKEAVIDINGTAVKVAIVHGLGNARKIMNDVKAGIADYHFIEIMACPGGCIGGGGNPIKTWAKMAERYKAIYELDKDLPIRKSHENPAIKQIYDEFLGKPLGEKSHHLLHTHYINRKDLLR